MYKIEIESDVELDYNASEAFKALRTNINFCGKDVSVVAITSCTPNEGKSITTYELAKTFASTGKKVLYVDADMRKSVFKSRFGVAAKGDGLSHYLSGLADIDDVTGEISFQNETHQYDELEAGSYKMHAIIAGAVPPNPSELLESDRFKEFIAYAKENYDYVFVDTPPLGAVIDAAIIAKQCDGVAVAVKSGEVSFRLAQKVVNQLRLSKCRILGVIYTMVPISTKRSSGYSKGYYSGYYGGYYGGGYYGKSAYEKSYGYYPEANDKKGKRSKKKK